VRIIIGAMAQPDFSPSAERNKQPILDVLLHHLPAQGKALEVASGTGQHVQWFAKHMPQWMWQPTEVHRGALYNIEVRVADAGLDNVLAALQLDVCTEPWFDTAAQNAEQFDAMVCINMLHIAPWVACGALMRGAARHLKPGALLVTYGPYFEKGVTPTPSNLEFDESLRAHDPTWGIRQREAVEQEAVKAGMRLRERHAMPSNNLLLVWERSSA
jgi:hypothetical protein